MHFSEIRTIFVKYVNIYWWSSVVLVLTKFRKLLINDDCLMLMEISISHQRRNRRVRTRERRARRSSLRERMSRKSVGLAWKNRGRGWDSDVLVPYRASYPAMRLSLSPSVMFSNYPGILVVSRRVGDALNFEKLKRKVYLPRGWTRRRSGTHENREGLVI